MANGRGTIHTLLAGEMRKIKVIIPAKWREKWGRRTDIEIPVSNVDQLPIDMRIWIDEDSGELQGEFTGTPKPPNGESREMHRARAIAEAFICA